MHAMVGARAKMSAAVAIRIQATPRGSTRTKSREGGSEVVEDRTADEEALGCVDCQPRARSPGGLVDPWEESLLAPP